MAKTIYPYNSPLVSVVIPAYNAEAFIDQTLESVISQTYRNFEVLVADDGSQDRTAEIVKSVALSDERVILLQQPNKGVAAARNLAIQKAKGKYIAPIDADDVWHPQKLEKQVQIMLETDPSVGLVYAWSVIIDEAGLITKVCQTSDVEGDVYISLLNNYFIGNASTALICRTCLEQVGDYKCQLREQKAQGCEDYDLYLRIARNYQFRVVPEILTGYRQVVGSMSFNDTSMKKSFNLVLAEARQLNPEIPAAIYRWNESNFSLYLAQQAIKSGNYCRTICYLSNAARLDFLPLLYPGFYKLFLKSFFKILTKPVTSLICTEYHPISKFKQKFRFADQVPEVSNLNRVETNKYRRFPRKQRVKLLARRCSQIQQKCRILFQVVGPETTMEKFEEKPKQILVNQRYQDLF